MIYGGCLLRCQGTELVESHASSTSKAMRGFYCDTAFLVAILDACSSSPLCYIRLFDSGVLFYLAVMRKRLAKSRAIKGKFVNYVYMSSKSKYGNI